MAHLLFAQYKFPEAKSQYKLVLKIYKDSFGLEHPQTLESMRFLASFLRYVGELDEARSLFEQTLALREKMYGPEHASTMESLNDLGTLLYSEGKYQETLPIFERVLAFREKEFGPEHPKTAASLGNLAVINKLLGNSEKARAQHERSLAISVKVLGPKHGETVQKMSNFAGFLRDLGELKEALLLFEKVLAIREEVLGESYPVTGETLRDLAGIHLQLSHFPEAQLLYEKSLRIAETAWGPDHENTSLALLRLASVLQDQAKYQEARPLYERALDIDERNFGPKHLGICRSLNQLATLLHAQGNYQEARPLFERVLAISERVQGKDHLDTADAMNNLADLLKAQGHYQAAELLLVRSQVVIERESGAEHPRTAIGLEALAALYYWQGNFKQAWPLYERALAINEKALGQEHQDTARSLNNLAILLQDQGNYQEALPLARRAVAIYGNVHGPKHPQTAMVLGNLATLLHAMELYEEAQSWFEQSIAALEAGLGLDHPNLAVALQNYANLLTDQGKSHAVRQLLDRSLAIREKALGASHPITAFTLISIATHMREQGDIEEALTLTSRALSIWKSTMGAEHPDTVRCMIGLAHTYVAQGNYQQALPLYQQAVSGSLARLSRELPSLSETGRMQMLEISTSPEVFLSCMRFMESPDLGFAYKIFLQWKGKATRLQAASIQLAQKGNTPGIRSKQGQIQVLANNLAKLIMLPLADQAVDHTEKIAAIRRERIQLERELNRQLGLDLALTSPSLEEVQAGLGEDDVLLDFFVGDGVYAWVLAKAEDPKFLYLGESDSLRIAQEAPLQAAVLRGGRVASVGGKIASPSKDFLRDFWQPLSAAVGNAETVFVSPDGFLCELPFGILQEGNGTYLLEKHRFIYLSDPTRLAAAKSGTLDPEGALLGIGGVDYFNREAVPEGQRAGLSTRSLIGDSWTFLPATKDEMRSLRELHEKVLQWQSSLTLIEGEAATEERIRMELPGHRYVHIATHGYFEPDTLPSLISDSRMKQAKANIGEQVQAVGLLPGLLSGLVFAGVNGAEDSNRDDGYLSAEEIQHIDLSACELVVLSACETALGSVRAGEGLMSLRRAFEVAGADTVVSSLWKVDDWATSILMKDFYTNLWQQGMTRGEALHQAKLRMLRRNRLEDGGDAKPSTWGAFVLSGDWN